MNERQRKQDTQKTGFVSLLFRAISHAELQFLVHVTCLKVNWR